MGKKGFFATLIAILILVFLLFPSSTGKEHILIPERILDLENPENIINPDTQGVVSFSMGDYFGYFTENLDLTYIDRLDYKVSISDSVFINYPKIPQILDVQNSNGTGRSIIETTGYPMIIGSRIVIISDSFISLYDLNGNLYWKKEILSIITSLSLTEHQVLISYLDGYCELISMSGETEFTYRPGGSRIDAVYSASISSDGQYISVISGLDPQRFILLQNRKEEYKPIFHFELQEEFRRSISMYFSEDNSQVFFENSAGINIFDVNLKTLTRAGNSGRMGNVYKDNECNFYSAMLVDKEGASLKLFTPDNRVILEKSFKGDSLFFRKKEDRFYVGTDNLLMSFQMVSK